jgi:iron complex transport system substrate-binding protein
MKTKNKTLALAEIVIVLFSILLVALPAIAADQTMQEVSASTITTTTSEDNDTFTLGIYGNANEDDTIDMRDTTYIKLAIFGKKPKTNLSDANNDGKVSMLDVGQTKLIILGKEKSLMVIDSIEDVVTVHKPIKRIIVGGTTYAAVLRALDAADRAVGVEEGIPERKVYYPKLSKLPNIGLTHRNQDFEAILDLNPDIVTGSFEKEHKEKLPGIPVVNLQLSYRTHQDFPENTRKLGYILDKREEAEEYIEWWESWINMIKERTDGLSDDEKPRVLIGKAGYPTPTNYWVLGKANPLSWQCKIAGGKNMGDIFPGWGGKPDFEWVITEDPEIMLIQGGYDPDEGGYEIDDPSKMKEEGELHINAPEFARLTAVKERKVYVYCAGAFGYHDAGANLVGIAYFAKLLQPDLFEDLNPEAIYREYLGFQHLDFDLDEHGVFVYPPIEFDDGLAGIPDRYKGQI